MNILDEANRLASLLADEFRTTMIHEDEPRTEPAKARTIVAYSGHFQPFHEGNYKIYEVLTKKFGKDNVYITTTNKIDEAEDPMSFEDKKKIITTMFPINESKLQEVENPYVPKELLRKYNPSSTSFVTVVDNEAVPILNKSKYFHRYVDGTPLRTYNEAGYYLTIPEVRTTVGGQALTDPQIMQVLGSPKTKPEVKERLFVALYGKSNPEILNLIKQKAAAGAAKIDGDFEKSKGTGQNTFVKPVRTKAHGQETKPDESEVDEKTPPMKRMIINPDTGREIKVQSALKYPRWKPVYKRAEKVLKNAGIDRGNRVDEPEVNIRYKKRAKNKTNEDWSSYLGISLAEDLQDIINAEGISLNLDELGDISLRLGESGTQPVAIYSGRFQPFHAGHFHAYEDLVKKFGKDNVYIASSNKTNSENSPFDFNDKKNIITKMFGVDPSKVVQVKDPYKAIEITSQLPSNTPVVWGVGEKDAQRLAGSKYFQSYNSEHPPTEGYKDRGYVYQVPQLPMQINGKTISGTGVRDVFAKGSSAAKKSLFEKLYGKFNPQIFDLVANRITKGSSQQTTDKPTTPKSSSKKFSKVHPINLDKTIKNPETGNTIKLKTALQYDDSQPVKKAVVNLLKQYETVTESFLTEGGAYGHLLHPYEDLDLTFSDLREMTKRALGTGLDKEGPIVEKTDGQNIMFTVRDGQVKFARSTKHLKNRGAEAMTPNELRQKFTGRGNIEQTFGDAGDELQQAVGKLSPNIVNKLFGDGRKFMSVEVIHPNSENTIPYGKNMLVLHHTVEFDDAGHPIGHHTEDSDIMADALRDVGADQQKEFGIRGQQFIVFDDEDNKKLEEKIVKYNAEIDVLEHQYGLSDTNTIQDYKKAWWTKELSSEKLPLSPEDRQLLINRWGAGAKSNRLTKLSAPEALSWAKKVESKFDDIDNKIMYPIQSYVARLGVDSLARSADLLSANNPEAGRLLTDKLASAINIIRKSGDKDKLSEMDRFLKLIDDIGIEKIVPSEGLIFNYNGKLYKFTGAFAPVHRIISAVKFDQPKENPQAEPAPHAPDIMRPKEPDNVPGKKSSNILGKKIRNPETDNDILVKTALGYEKNHPARKAAEKLVSKTETLSEGGNAVPVNSKVPNALALPTVAAAAEALGIGNVDRALVGSTFKPLMGDLDVATDRTAIRKAVGYNGTDKMEFFSHLKKYLEPKGFEVNLSPGFEQFSISAPLVDTSGKHQSAVDDNGKSIGQPGHVQVDFMMGNVPWMKQWMTNGDQSEYGPTYRNALTADVFGKMIFDTDTPNVKWKYQINPRDGLEKIQFKELPNGKKDVLHKELVSSDVDDVAKAIFGKHATYNDMNTFEKLNTKIQSPDFPYKDKVSAIYQTYAKGIEKMKKPLPKGIPTTTTVEPQVAATPSTNQDILNSKITNPETKNDILVRTALKYDKSHPAYKAAEKFIRTRNGTVADRLPKDRRMPPNRNDHTGPIR